MLITRWEPAPLTMRPEMEPFFEEDMEARELEPAFEIRETKEAFVFKADLPGIDERHVEITALPHELRIAGTRDEERPAEGDRMFMHERVYGAFERAFELPEAADVDRAVAELKDGVLTIAVPKKPEHRPRKIAVVKHDGAEELALKTPP